MLILAVATVVLESFRGRSRRGYIRRWNVHEHNMDALVAELQAIKHWEAGETPATEGEIEARRIRQLEIFNEIALLRKADQDSEEC